VNAWLGLTRRWSLIALAFSLAACASNPMEKATLGANSPQWQGRLSIKVLSNPVQAFAANFDLQGTPEAGALNFTTPLGSTLAQIQWDKTGARLQTTGAPEQFESLDALTLRSTGVALPLASLFAWLHGREIATPGWEVDLQLLSQGRLSAKRLEAGSTPAELKIILNP
jgi:outer membrane lipoprotein LolB